MGKRYDFPPEDDGLQDPEETGLAPYGGNDPEEDPAGLVPEETAEFDFGDDPGMDEISEFIPDETPEFDFSASRRNKKARRAILFVIIGVILALIGLAGLYLYTLSSDPASVFVPEPDMSQLAPAETATPEAEVLSPTPEITPDPYMLLQQTADQSMMHNIVNIMLIGVDYAQERETWKGKNALTASHADVMIVLAVDFDHHTANLISLPRDTYAKIPGVSGIYKLNASLDCGGGLTAPDGAGFKKVCESASRMLGGLPVNYYYAVTMPAVKQLVDSIGGVDYDLEISFKIQSRSYQKGFQHMDGQAVLDYLRVRKSGSGLSSGQTGDANRVNRQKKMLLAIFDKIKENGMLSSIPDLLSSFSGQLYTNCGVSQTAALALEGYKMSSDSISMYSFSGPMKNIYTWNFCFPTPSNRRDIIKKIYGVDVPDLLDCTLDYAEYYLQATYADQYLETTADLYENVQKRIASGNLVYGQMSDRAGSGLPDSARAGIAFPMGRLSGLIPFEALLEGEDEPVPGQEPDPTQEPEVTPEPDPTETPYVTPEPTPAVTPVPTAPPTAVPEPTETPLPSETPEVSDDLAVACFALTESYDALYALQKEARNYASSYLRGGASGSLEGYASRLQSACADLKASALTCANLLGYPAAFSWEIEPLADTNEIYVDFR